MVNAGGSIYAASRATADSLLRVVGEGGGVEPRGSFPISPPSWQRIPPVAGEGVPSLNNLEARALRVPRLCGVQEVGHGPVGARLAINGNGNRGWVWGWKAVDSPGYSRLECSRRTEREDCCMIVRRKCDLRKLRSNYRRGGISVTSLHGVPEKGKSWDSRKRKGMKKKDVWSCPGVKSVRLKIE